jgi:multiple sugar transport system permease protein
LTAATASIGKVARAHAKARQGQRSRILLTVLLTVFLVYTFIPLAYLVISATKGTDDLFGTFGFWFGEKFSLGDNLRDLFTQSNGVFLRWLVNSFVYASVSGIGAALLSTAAGYAFAKYSFVGRKAIFALILGAAMIPQTALVIPIFLLLAQWGLANNPLGVVLPSMISPIGVYLMRTYIEHGVDNELIDAARVEGAGEFRIFRDIVFRLVAPGFVTVLLLSFVSTWNNYFLPLIVLRSQEYFPLPVGLAAWNQLAASAGGGSRVLFPIVITGALVSIVPVIIVFLMLQRFWQGGLSIGALK